MPPMLQTKILRAAAACCAAALLAIPAAAPAWGWFGHHATMHLAEKEMEPEVLEAVKDLLGDTSMNDASVWADRVRPQRRETAPFHYVNAPRGVLAPRDEDLGIPQGNVWAAVLGYSEMVADESLPREERREALMFLLHFIGDLHQPLHCGFADDLGANRVPVLHDGRRFNLHRIWDTEILGTHLEGAPDELAEALWACFSDEDRAAWAAVGDPRDWVAESRAVIFAGLYPPPRIDIPGEEEAIVVIDDLYLEIWTPVAEKQLARAGSRTAAVLNAIFTTGTSPFDSPPIPFPPARAEAAAVEDRDNE